jgi:hypothetical protein
VALQFTGKATKSVEADRMDVEARNEDGKLVLCSVSREALEDHAGLRDWGDPAACAAAYARIRNRVEERLTQLYDASAPMPRGERIIVTSLML